MVGSWLITLYTLWQLCSMHEVNGKRFNRYHELGQVRHTSSSQSVKLCRYNDSNLHLMCWHAVRVRTQAWPLVHHPLPIDCHGRNPVLEPSYALHDLHSAPGPGDARHVSVVVQVGLAIVYCVTGGRRQHSCCKQMPPQRSCRKTQPLHVNDYGSAVPQERACMQCGLSTATSPAQPSGSPLGL